MYFVIVTSEFQFLDVSMSKQTESFGADVLVVFVGLVVFGFSFNEVGNDVLHIKSRDIVLRVNNRNPLNRSRKLTSGRCEGRRLIHYLFT